MVKPSNQRSRKWPLNQTGRAGGLPPTQRSATSQYGAAGVATLKIRWLCLCCHRRANATSTQPENTHRRALMMAPWQQSRLVKCVAAGRRTETDLKSREMTTSLAALNGTETKDGVQRDRGRVLIRQNRNQTRWRRQRKGCSHHHHHLWVKGSTRGEAVRAENRSN